MGTSMLIDNTGCVNVYSTQKLIRSDFVEQVFVLLPLFSFDDITFIKKVFLVMSDSKWVVFA